MVTFNPNTRKPVVKLKVVGGMDKTTNTTKPDSPSGIITTTINEFVEYMGEPNEHDPSFQWGPLVSYNTSAGGQLIQHRGHYVSEYQHGKEHQTYWVERPHVELVQ